MTEKPGCGELQQLVQEEECEEPLCPGGEATPPSTPARSKHPNKNDTHSSHVSQQVLWESNTEISPIVSKGSSGQATSQGSMVSGRAVNLSNYGNQSRLSYMNEKERQRPTRPESSKLNRQHKEVPDVRRMEQALLQLLEDFHSGNLRAFGMSNLYFIVNYIILLAKHYSKLYNFNLGKDCSMEQMTEIREQQERLARLHFELGQRQDISGEQSGLRHSSANMRHLLHRLQQLSICIEKLHSK
ncbi:Coiled-coil domain-containing protein 28B [Dufourea novaeangliae]|uniref:Coiled-coil domain-containing protein 28B n=1 Tax=Dufourea novaeangliae TaxID=178035 RepID=A0A154PIF2_DUFNO|nr:Coiled-coil domain-containing protein 28B [Dufourea novaeangliae]